MTSLSLRRTRKNIRNSDPGKILDLVTSLDDDACSILQMKINTYLMEECDAELVFAIVVNCDRSEAYIEAVGKTVLERKNKLSECQKFVSVVRNSRELMITFNNFNDDVKKMVSPYLPMDSGKRHVMLVPVVGRPFGLVVCLVSPKEQEEHVVTFVYECFLVCWPIVKKTIQLEYESTMKYKCQQLLRVAKRLFTQVTTLGPLMKLTIEQTKYLIHGEYCALLIIDLDRMELVETCYPKGEGETTEKRFPMGRGIVGHVINTGAIVNARYSPAHPAYDPDIDGRPGIDLKTSLTFPIREQAGIIGVGHLINKIGDPYFDTIDEEMALSYSVYCGICISHSMVYQKIMETNIRNVLASEMVLYHLKVGDAEVSKVLECTAFHRVPDLTSLYCDTRGLPLKELPCYVVRMFNDLGFIKTFDLKHPKLARFVLQVRKSYRDVPHHNWCHAFSATQWAYAAMYNFQLVRRGYFNDLQAMMYLIACLVHDLDHRGAPSSFQINGQTSLSALYCSEGSVMERHHLSQAICILNTEGCDILEPLSRRDYDRALLLLRDYVLATDMNNYFKNFDEYKMISSDYLMGNFSHIAALQALLINAADLSDHIKEWSAVKKTAAEALTEFFNQSNSDKGGLPLYITNGGPTVIPDLEIQFLTDTCIPLYQMIADIFPPIAPCIKILEGHIVQWDGAKDVFAEVPITAGLSVVLSAELDDLIDASLKERERLRLEAEALAAEQAALAAAAAAAAAAEED